MDYTNKLLFVAIYVNRYMKCKLISMIQIHLRNVHISNIIAAVHIVRANCLQKVNHVLRETRTLTYLQRCTTIYRFD